MAVKVRIPHVLRHHTGNASMVEVNAGTLREILSELESRFPGLKDRLLDERGVLRPYIHIYVNGDDARRLKGAETIARDGDEVGILPAMAGGRIWAKK